MLFLISKPNALKQAMNANAHFIAIKEYLPEKNIYELFANVAQSDGAVQSCVPILVLGIDVSPALEQHSHTVYVLVHSC